MAPQNKQKRTTRNQRRQQRSEQNGEKGTEESVNLTDLIDNFRAACLNRSKDIRNFADGRDSIIIDEDEQQQLKGLTNMLTEQLGFLEDGWDTMMRYAEKYQIDLAHDEAYKAMKLSKAHALRVAGVAFQISDRFLSAQAYGQRDGEPGNDDRSATEDIEATTSAEGTTTANNEAKLNVTEYDETTQMARETGAAATEREASLQEGQEKTQGLTPTEREKATREESNNNEDPKITIVLDDLKDETEESVQEIETQTEERTTEEAYRATASRKEETVYQKTQDNHRAKYAAEEVQPVQRAREREYNEDKREEGTAGLPERLSVAERDEERGSVKPKKETLTTDSQLTLAGGRRRTKKRYQQIEETKKTMDPYGRIVARVGGKHEREKEIARRWRIDHRYKAKQDDRAMMSCTIKVQINGRIYTVSCYKRSTVNGAHVFRCPTPSFVHHLWYDKARETDCQAEDEYATDTLLWLTPTPGDGVVTAWKPSQKDPYARIRKGIGVCYHCGRKCGEPNTCTARNRTCFVCESIGHTMRACEWRYKTKRVPTHSTTVHPKNRTRICEELTQYVEDFLEMMTDEPHTRGRPTRILEIDMSREEANAWLGQFELYFASKEIELIKRGYQTPEHGRLVLNAYVDQKLEAKLNHDAPPGLPIRGEQSCTAHLKRYFKEKVVTDYVRERKKENNTTQSRMPAPADPAPGDNEWLMIDLMNHHDDFTGRKAAQAREHEHLKRRSGYTYKAIEQKQAGATAYKHETKRGANLNELPNETLERICQYLPYRSLKNLKRATKRLRDFIEESHRLYESVSLTGAHLDESLLHAILTNNDVKHLDISRGGMGEDNGTIEQDIWAYTSHLEGICLSGFRGPDVQIASIISALANLTTLDISYSRLQLVSEVSRALEDTTRIKAINIGTSPYMRLCYPENAEPLRYVMARLLRKCPQLTYIVLHGLDMFHWAVT